MVRSAVRERIPHRSSAATIIKVPRSDEDRTIDPSVIALSTSERCAPGVRRPMPQSDCAKSCAWVANNCRTVAATSPTRPVNPVIFCAASRRLSSSLGERTEDAAEIAPVWRGPLMPCGDTETQGGAGRRTVETVIGILLVVLTVFVGCIRRGGNRSKL